MTHDPQREPDALDAVGGWVGGSSAPMTEPQRQDGLRAVALRLETHRRTRPRRLAVATFLCAGAAVGGALLLVRAVGPTPPAGVEALRFEVDGGAIGDGGYVTSQSASGARVRFSEGTEVHLLPGARGRLGRVDAAGARFAIEQGMAEVSVTPRPNARWLVDAGPFLITVRGTVFTAAWDGAGERLDIDMKKGLVSVTGPVAEGPVAVRAGQHLTVNVPHKEVVLRETSAGPHGQPVNAEHAADDGEPGTNAAALAGPAGSTGSSGAPSGEPAAEAQASLHEREPALAPRATGAGARERALGVQRHRVAPSIAAPDGRAAGAPRTWTAWLAAGDLDRVLADAQRRGVKAVLARAPEVDLAALADAARYRRHDELARRTLLAQRARFPGSTRARDAAFLLGRLEDDRSSGGAIAIRWYDRYLEEAPGGAFASEALGRKMTATERTRGSDAAREIAREYLRRFPGGTYAKAARAFLDRP